MEKKMSIVDQVNAFRLVENSNEQTYEGCLEAVKLDPRVLMFVRKEFRRIAAYSIGLEVMVDGEEEDLFQHLQYFEDKREAKYIELANSMYQLETELSK
jgi:hypothetical protein